LKRYKSPGKDEIPAELIILRREILRTKVHKLINSIYAEDELPDEWKNSITGKFKKGGTGCSNYLGILML
jgi:hypothetical protein